MRRVCPPGQSPIRFDHALKRTARRRRRQEVPLRGTGTRGSLGTRCFLAPRSGGFPASTPLSRAFQRMVGSDWRLPWFVPVAKAWTTGVGLAACSVGSALVATSVPPRPSQGAVPRQEKLACLLCSALPSHSFSRRNGRRGRGKHLWSRHLGQVPE